MKKRIVVLITVVSIFITSCEAVFVEDISTQTVVLLAPTDLSTVPTGAVTFSWEAITDAENYHLQVSTPSFQNATQIVLDTLVTTTEYTKELAVGNYQWRVKATNSDYETEYTTNAFIVH